MKKFDYNLLGDDFCMLWSHKFDCFIEPHTLGIANVAQIDVTEKENNNDVVAKGITLVYGKTKCELIATGYLRSNFINPNDIYTIIVGYLGENSCSVDMCIKNRHNYCMILFPSMQQVCIKFSQMITSNHGCEALGCRGYFSCRCGIIGIPKVKQLQFQVEDSISQWNLQTFYTRFANFIPKSNDED